MWLFIEIIIFHYLNLKIIIRKKCFRLELRIKDVCLIIAANTFVLSMKYIFNIVKINFGNTYLFIIRIFLTVHFFYLLIVQINCI